MYNALIISYLFLGGMGAGSFLVLVCSWALSSRMAFASHGTNPLLKPGYRGFLGAGFGVSLAIQVLGIICLLADLERPEALTYLIISPQPTAITIGAYALAILVICSLILALSRLGVVGFPRLLEGILAFVGAIDSCVVMVYTALLLRACVGDPLWSSPFIPVLFVLSSLSTGIACVVVVSAASRGCVTETGLIGSLLTVDSFLVIAELVTLALFVLFGLLGSNAQGAYEQLLWGAFSEVFWLGLVGLGLLAPVLLRVYGRCLPGARVSPLLIAFLVMVGGVCLRCCIVGAGVI